MTLVEHRPAPHILITAKISSLSVIMSICLFVYISSLLFVTLTAEPLNNPTICHHASTPNMSKLRDWWGTTLFNLCKTKVLLHVLLKDLPVWHLCQVW